VADAERQRSDEYKTNVLLIGLVFVAPLSFNAPQAQKSTRAREAKPQISYPPNLLFIFDIADVAIMSHP